MIILHLEKLQFIVTDDLNQLEHFIAEQTINCVKYFNGLDSNTNLAG